MTGQLLRALATQSAPSGVGPLRDEIDDALIRLRRQRTRVVNDVLVEALGRAPSAPIVAALIRRREWWELPFAEPLLKALIRGMDSKSLGWPILMALRDYATPPLGPPVPTRPSEPKPPELFEKWAELQKQREAVSNGIRLSQVTEEIDSLIKTLPEAVAADPTASDPANPKSPARKLQRLHETRTRLESGEELRSLDEQIVAMRPEHEKATESYAQAELNHTAVVARYEEAIKEYHRAREAEHPQGQWPAGLLPLKQWLRDEPRRLEDASRNRDWRPIFIALYGGVKDYRVGRYEAAYEKAVEGFHEFSYTYANVQDDAIYERAVALDNFKPSPARWRANLPFGFSPDFVFRHSPLHGELVARFDAGDPPNADGWLERLWNHRLPEVRVEAALALFAAGGDVEPLLAVAWAAGNLGKREAVAATLHALEGLLAGWRETLEHLLPKNLVKMLSCFDSLPVTDAEALREMLLANVQHVADPKRRAAALWQLLPGVSIPLICEVWEEALDATWTIAGHLGYDEPVYDCNVLLDTHEGPAAKALGKRFPKETFNRLFAETLCPEWAEHPDLFAEALHEHIARTPPTFDESFQDRLLQGKDSLADVCAAWFSISGRYPFAVVLDNCGVKVPANEEGFYSFALEQIATLDSGRQARTTLRLARYLPLGFRQSPIDHARSLTDAIADPAEKLATYESILTAMPSGPEQTALADSIIGLTDHHPSGRARIYSQLRLLPLVSADRLLELRGRLLVEFGQIADVVERAAIIRQACRWARAEVQAEVLRIAAAALPEDRLRRWVAGRLSPDLLAVLHRAMAASADDQEVMLAWTLAALAARAADLLSAFAQQQDSNPWSMLATNEALAIDRLLLIGEKAGLPLTISAVSAVDWMNAHQRDDLLKLFLPLLERPSREVWPSVYRWLDDPNPLIVQHAALVIAEHGRQITPRTFPHLLALLEGDLDRSRLRAALTLHGRVVHIGNEERMLLASRLGKETLDRIGRAIHARRPDRLSPELLAPSIAAGRQRSSAKVLDWMRHQLVFDNPQLIREYLACLSTEPTSEAVVGLLDACSSTVLEVLAESLTQELLPSAQRVMLTMLAKLNYVRTTKYRMRPEDEDWNRLTEKIPAWFARLPQQIRREQILLSDADDLIGAFIAAARQAQPDPPSGDLKTILGGCRGAYGPLGEMELATSPDKAMDFLKILGERSYYDVVKAPTAARAAAEALSAEPMVFPLLLKWLAILLREDLNDPPLADIRQVLLETVAAFADQHPSTVAAQALEMNLLPLFCRVVTFSSHFRSRADAILLIGALRRLTEEAAIALLSALRDVFEVQNVALLAVDRFRYVDQAALELMLVEISPANDSSTAIYGAARLLAGLAASECLTASQRQTVLRKLAATLQNPAVCRRGVYLMTGSGDKDEKGLRVRQEARLGEVLYEALLRVAGGTLQLRSPIKQR